MLNILHVIINAIRIIIIDYAYLLMKKLRVRKADLLIGYSK